MFAFTSAQAISIAQDGTVSYTQPNQTTSEAISI